MMARNYQLHNKSRNLETPSVPCTMTESPSRNLPFFGLCHFFKILQSKRTSTKVQSSSQLVGNITWMTQMGYLRIYWSHGRDHSPNVQSTKSEVCNCKFICINNRVLLDDGNRIIIPQGSFNFFFPGECFSFFPGEGPLNFFLSRFPSPTSRSLMVVPLVNARNSPNNKVVIVLVPIT